MLIQIAISIVESCMKDCDYFLLIINMPQLYFMIWPVPLVICIKMLVCTIHMEF